MMKKKQSDKPIRKWLWGIAITAACIAALVIFSRSITPGSAQLPMARYDGKKYWNRNGSYTWELPEGAKHLGQTNYVRKSKNFDADLDCNVRSGGCLFADPNDDSILYFEFAAWNEAAAGQKKYLILVWIDA